MCDSVAAIANGRVLFAKNSDRDPNEAQALDWQPARTHPRGATVRCTWVEIPQVERTRACLLSRPFWMWGAEIGANDAGLVIGNEAVFTNARLDERGLTGMDLLRLALERSSDRRNAVEVIGDLLDRHGQGGGCGYENLGFRYSSSFLLADATGISVLETAGRARAVEHIDVVPGVRRVRSISNRLSIAAFARKHGQRLPAAVARSGRRARITAVSTRDAEHAGDMMAALRDHGGDAPRFSPVNGAMGGPCVHAGGFAAASQTTASWVSEIGPASARHWVTATAAPCLSMFKPVAVDAAVDFGRWPNGRADPTTLWWRFEEFHRRAMAKPDCDAVRALLKERGETEQRWLQRPPEPKAAFAAFDDWLARARTAVAAAPMRDHRPGWLQRYWRARDNTAGRSSS